MSGFKQTVINTVPTNRGLGRASTQTLIEMFPASPIHSQELSDAERVNSGITALEKGIVHGSDGYYGFNGGYSRDFSDNGAPDVPGGVEAGGPGGEPATAYIPNPTVPGPGNTNPLDMPAPPQNSEFMNLPTNNSFPSSGGGSSVNPLEASKKMSQATIGTFISGRSYAGSNE